MSTNKQFALFGQRGVTSIRNSISTVCRVCVLVGLCYICVCVVLCAHFDIVKIAGDLEDKCF